MEQFLDCKIGAHVTWYGLTGICVAQFLLLEGRAVIVYGGSGSIRPSVNKTMILSNAYVTLIQSNVKNIVKNLTSTSRKYISIILTEHIFFYYSATNKKSLNSIHCDSDKD